MHIAFLTPEYPHEKVSHAAGIGTSIKNLAQALVMKGGVSVSVFVYSQNEDLIIEEDNIKLHLIKRKHYSFFTWFFYRKHVQNYLNRFIKSDGIDLIEAPDWTGITAFVNLKAPLIVRFHGSDAYFCHLENRKQKLKNYWFEKMGIMKAKAFIAPTDFAGRLTAKLFSIQNKKVKVIHNGIPLSDFNNTNPDDFESGLLIYIGTLIRKKGVLEFPGIMSTLLKINPNARLILIGADSFDVQTQSRSTWELLQSKMDDNLKDKISYLGKVPYSEIKKYIQKANVCVFPTFAETQGMVTIESMAMRKAVVNSNIGWAKDLIIDGESGFLVHPENHAIYSERIAQLLENKDLVLEIGNNARKRAEAIFDIDKIVLKNIDFYKQQL